MPKLHRPAAKAFALVLFSAAFTSPGSSATQTPKGSIAAFIPPAIGITPARSVVRGLAGTESLLAKAHYDKARHAYFSPLEGGSEAQLTLDHGLQSRFEEILKQSRLETGAIVAMEPRTGRLLGLAEISHDGKRGAALDARYPAASVFKIVTAAALLEAGVDPDTETCFHGGFHRIQANLLRDDPRRDGRCASMALAMGKSLNVVFGKLAAKDLDAESLRAMAGRFFFNQPLPLIPEPSVDEALVSPAFIPDDPLEFDRTAAGFGQVFLSPLHGAILAGIVANGGVAVAPRMVDAVWSEGRPIRSLPSHEERVIEPRTAANLLQMMELTVSEGTARKAFRVGRHWALGDVIVAGKTGTLADHSPFRDYSWFVGFAPANHPSIAVAVVAVNGPKWTVRAPIVAREALEANFAR